jgi:putative ABC transport system permease protein
MSTLEVHDQPRPGLRRLLQLTTTAIRFRFMRSTVTTVVITVAVAFVVHMVVSALGGRGLRAMATAELAELRLADVWATRFTQPAGNMGMLRQWAAPDTEPSVLAAQARSVGFDDETAAAVRAGAEVAVATLRRVDRLEPLTRREILGRAAGWDLLDVLAAVPAEVREATLLRQGLARDPLAGLWAQVAQTWPETAPRLRELATANSAAVRRLEVEFAGRPPLGALAAAAPELRAAVAAAGFSIDEATWERIAQRAQARLEAAAVEAGIGDLELRRALAARLDRQPQDVLPSLLWRFLRREAHAEWFAAEWARARGEVPPWQPARAAELARENRREAALAAAAVSTGADTGGLFGLGRRTTILVAVSLLVCVVGITNAMLMSVTERYREIATLKCLGALDGTVLWIFVLEALLLGLAGAAVGALTGGLIALAVGAATHGGLFLAGVPWGGIALALLAALGLGAAMAALASVYPSWKAARLPPLEAMRIE